MVSDSRKPPLIASILVRQGALREDQLQPFLEEQRKDFEEWGHTVRIGEMLVEAGLITTMQLQRALEEQANYRSRMENVRWTARQLGEASRQGDTARLEKHFREAFEFACGQGYYDEFREGFFAGEGRWEDWQRLKSGTPAPEAPAAEPTPAPVQPRREEPIAVQTESNLVIIRPRSELNSETVPTLRQVVETAQQRGRKWLILDLSAHKDIPVSALGCLIDLETKARAAGGSLVVVRPARPIPRGWVKAELARFEFVCSSLREAEAYLKVRQSSAQ